MQSLLSIIVPVFNVEKYLVRCIESLIHQEYPNFEIILVDDGSSDNSGTICENYASIDFRIKVLHLQNQGVGFARNCGLDLAMGDYITFIDSDDYIAPNTYSQNLILFTQDPELDVIQIPTQFGNTIKKEDATLVFNGEKDIFSSWWEGRIITFHVWNKVFRKEIFSTIRFPEGCISEDTFLVVDLSNKTRKVLLSNIGCYYYTVRDNSLSNSIYTYEKHIDLFNALFKIHKKLWTFDHLHKFRLLSFTRVYRRFIKTQKANLNADLKVEKEHIKKYIPRWKDILMSQSTLKEKIWVSCVKILGISCFMHLYIYKPNKDSQK